MHHRLFRVSAGSLALDHEIADEWILSEEVDYIMDTISCEVMKKAKSSRGR